MTLKKDKQKVLGESFNDDRIKTFLRVQAPAGVSQDFHALELAYRGMNHENFSTFVRFFKEESRDLNAENPNGKTLLELLKTHRHAGPYIAALEAD